MTNQLIKQVDLYMTEGSSDKHYQVRLVQNPKGFLVEYANGRRGSPLRHGLKTQAEVDEATAITEFEKVIKSKKKGGYTEDRSGHVYLNTEDAGRVLPFRPHLLTPINHEDLLKTISSKHSAYGFQIKHDGERRYLSVASGEVTGGNRKGLAVPVSEHVCKELKAIAEVVGDFEIDCEDMGSYIVAFDLLSANGQCLKGQSFQCRYDALVSLFGRASSLSSSVFRYVHYSSMHVPSSLQDALTYIETARKSNEEGVVMKLLCSTYTPGESNQSQFKLKFWASASVRVQSAHPLKRSVAIELMDDSGEWVAVGNCSIPVSVTNVPVAGDIIDVRYLYAHHGGSLYQPTFERNRSDIETNACSMSQLKYKKDEDVLSDSLCA